MTVTQITPTDITDVRDPGMRALILLASSLGWNILRKLNNPIVITARDGTQRRIPTNTSIRMSVFQSLLSAILTHSEDPPSADLMREIVATTKLDRDHARRMWLAIDETPEEHQRHIEAAEAEPKGAREPQPVTQRIEVPIEAFVDTEAFDELVEPDVPPADGEDHGTLIQTGPFYALKTGASGSGTTYRYESEAILQRDWEDGYVDYLCIVCRAFAVKTPRGIGTHRAVHVRNGETQRSDQNARQTKVYREAPPVRPPVLAAPSTGPLIDQIRALVSPDLIAERDKLAAENDELRAANTRLADNLKALKDLISGL